MLIDSKAYSEKCNGRLGSKFNINLEYKLEQNYTDSYRLTLFSWIKKNQKISTPVKYLKNQIRIVLFTNESISKVEYVDLDFTYSDEISIMSDIIDIRTSTSTRVPIEVRLEIIDDESGYLSDSAVKCIIPIYVKNASSSLFTKLETIDETDDLIDFRILHSENPDFVEFKVGDNPWVKTESDTITIAKEDRPKYIQARIKKDNTLVYSMAFRMKSKTV